MKVNSVDFNLLQTKGSVQQSNKHAGLQTFEKKLQTSLYMTKGVNVYFGGLAKGINLAEDKCIELLRGALDGQKRWFNENEIQNIVNTLRKVDDNEKKFDIVYEILELKNCELEKLPDGKFVNKLVNVLAARPEEEHFPILEFALNDLKKAVNPMDAFFKLPFDKQDSLTKILGKIDEINDKKLFKSSKARESTVDSLYDTFRVLLYGHEDLNKAAGTAGFKSENIEILEGDRFYYENLKTYAGKKSKEKVMAVVDEMIQYFDKNI